MLDAPACFNPLDRGNLYQINMDGKVFDASMTKFQSPRSRKFVSNVKNANRTTKHTRKRFNPLDRGNLYQILLAACV